MRYRFLLIVLHLFCFGSVFAFGDFNEPFFSFHWPSLESFLTLDFLIGIGLLGVIIFIFKKISDTGLELFEVERCVKIETYEREAHVERLKRKCKLCSAVMMISIGVTVLWIFMGEILGFVLIRMSLPLPWYILFVASWKRDMLAEQYRWEEAYIRSEGYPYSLI